VRITFFDPSPLDYVIDTPRVKPLGGSQSALCYLAEELAGRGHAVTLVNSTTAPGTSRGVDCFRFEQIPLACHAEGAVAIVLSGASPEIPRRIRALWPRSGPIVLWCHHNRDQAAVAGLADSSTRACWDRFVFVSAWQAGGYRETFGIDGGRMKVIANAVSPAFEGLFPDPQAIVAEKPWPPVLCYTSTPFRGLEVLLEAFPRIRAAIPGTRLRVFSGMSLYGVRAGEDPYARLYERCRASEGVEYVGPVSQTELARELRAATCFAYPCTFEETFCIAALEAMAAGCVVIASDLGALRDTTAGFGQLVAPDPDKGVHARRFADFAVEVLDEYRRSPQARERLAEQVAAVNRTATWRVRAGEWESWLRSLVET
jgi:glycosyltransferase involved in cell wall biosynthesis